MKKQSMWLISISMVLLIISAANILIAGHLTRDIANDTHIINAAGIIRGSMQRAIKLEFGNMGSDVLIRHIDTRLDQFASNSPPVKSHSDTLVKAMQGLKADWSDAKKAIKSYRANPSAENISALMSQSEKIWIKSDNAVAVAQFISEHRRAYYKLLFLLLFVNLIMIAAITIISKYYVRDQLEYAVHHDWLTRIYNRFYLMEALKGEIAYAERYKINCTLVAFDIDFFKQVNDTYGHLAGDLVLKGLAELVAGRIRSSDIFARTGGEEFMILLKSTDLDGALSLAEKLRAIIENHEFGDVGKITVSFGAAQFVSGDTVESLYKKADSALYSAKEKGRNCVAYFELCPI